MNTKLCRRCGQEKPVEEFNKRKVSRDGLKSWCRACDNEAGRVYRENNLDKTTQRNQRYYQDNREQELERIHTYQASHRKQMLENALRYATAHREECNQYIREYYQRRRAAEGSHTNEEWLLICEQYGYRCIACGAKKQLTRDHVVPLSQGGRNDIQNIQPLCRSCNAKKHTKTIDYRK